MSAADEQSGGSVSACLTNVIFTFILLLAALILVGGALSSGGSAYAYGSGNCAVSTRYPPEVLRWCGLITVHSQENQIHPDLVAALIWQESGGNPSAYSKSGAVGLMQVMPRDGRAEIFQCNGEPCFADRPTIRELQDPNFNVSYGTQMLRNLSHKYKGDMREALKAYGPMDVGYRYADIVLALYRQYGRY